MRCYVGLVPLSLRYRDATADDLANVLELVQSAYRGEASRAGWTTEADLLDGQRTDLDDLSNLLQAPSRTLVLAHAEGRLMGSVLLAAEEDALHLGMLAVRPTQQGRGVGRALLALAEVRAAAAQLTRVRMSVIAQRSELLAWYERRGYERTGERTPFPYGEPRFGLPRRPDLYFVVLQKSLAAEDGRSELEGAR